MEEIHKGYTTFKSRDSLENKLIYIYCVYITTTNTNIIIRMLVKYAILLNV